jgi:hypothetical protein
MSKEKTYTGRENVDAAGGECFYVTGTLLSLFMILQRRVPVGIHPAFPLV